MADGISRRFARNTAQEDELDEKFFDSLTQRDWDYLARYLGQGQWANIQLQADLLSSGYGEFEAEFLARNTDTLASLLLQGNGPPSVGAMMEPPINFDALTSALPNVPSYAPVALDPRSVNESPGQSVFPIQRVPQDGVSFTVNRTQEPAPVSDVVGRLAVYGDMALIEREEIPLEVAINQRINKNANPIQRGIIRHFVLVLDLSDAMAEKDMRPSRYVVTINYAIMFVKEYFNQNPISQLGIIGIRDGLAIRITDMSGSHVEHVEALQKLRKELPQGLASLENPLELCRGALFHVPEHGTREVLIILGAINISDPGDIMKTIAALVAARITVSIIGLSAQVAVCRTIVARTNPGVDPQDCYNVAIDERHLRELLEKAIEPPPLPGGPEEENAEPDKPKPGGALLKMGFPSRTFDRKPTLCACHSRPSKESYNCPRCASKVCSLPTQCPVCNMMLIMSTHLARSYHHLFPLQNWLLVSWDRVRERERELRHAKEDISRCLGCQEKFPAKADKPSRSAAQNGTNPPPLKKSETTMSKPATVPDADEYSESHRYECPACHFFFCIDCDKFAHEVLHNCPGCTSRKGRWVDGKYTSLERTTENGDVEMAG